MRISCDPGDQGFTPAHAQFIATLDGMAMPHAVMADEELQMIRIVGRTPCGSVIDQVLFGRVKIERVH